MKLLKTSLATRVIFGMVAIVVIGTATLLFGESIRLRNNFLNERRAHIENDLDANELRLREMINSLRRDVLFLSNVPPIAGIIRAEQNHNYDALEGDSRARWEKRLQGIFSAFSDANPDYYKIRYIGVDGGGRVLAQVDNNHIQIEHKSPDQFDQIGSSDFFKAGTKLNQGQVWLSKFELTSIDKNHPLRTLLAVTPVFTDSGKMFGLVVVNLDANNLLKSAESNLPGIKTFVSNREGQYLTHPELQRTLNISNVNNHNITRDFPIVAPMFDLQKADYRPLQKFSMSSSEADSLLAAKRIHYDPNDPSGFLLVSYLLPGAEVKNQLSVLPTSALLGEFFVVLLVTVIAMLILRRTFSPLTQLTLAADKIAAGEHDVVLPRIKGGEIGSLTSAINSMLVRLSQREKALQDSEADLLGTLNAIPDLLFEIGINGRFYSYHSPRAELLASPPEFFLGRKIADILPDDAATITMAAVAEANSNGYSFGKQIEIKVPDGKMWFELSVARKPSSKDDEPRFVVLSRDTTERKNYEQQLQKLSNQILQFSEELSDLYERAPCGYHSIDKHGIFLRINETELNWLGYTREEIVGGKSIIDLLTPAAIVSFQQSFPQLRELGKVHDLEMEFICKDGTILPVLINATAIRDTEGNFIASRTTVYNMTERKKMDQERYAYVKRLEETSRHLVASQEEVRKRLSSELHDRTSPNLAAISLNLKIIASAMDQDQSPDIYERLEDTTALIADTSTSIREICADMRPPLLDYAGFSAAIESYLQQYSRRTGIEVYFDCVNREQRYSQELESLLFRIAQEALTNCAKHAQAESVTVSFNNGEYPLSLAISDDGIGFAPAQLGKDGVIGLGVLNMREMVEIIGGRLIIESSPGYGTRIVVDNLF